MAKRQLGDSEGTTALVRVLLLHRHQQHADVRASLRAAAELGTVSEDVVALEARKAAQAIGRAPSVTAAPPSPAPPKPPGPELPQVSHLALVPPGQPLPAAR